MFWKLLDQLAGLIRRSKFSERPVEDQGATFRAESEREFTRSSRLFHCDRCDVTFISREMDSCSRCGRAIEETPSEHELNQLQIQNRKRNTGYTSVSYHHELGATGVDGTQSCVELARAIPIGWIERSRVLGRRDGVRTGGREASEDRNEPQPSSLRGLSTVSLGPPSNMYHHLNQFRTRSTNPPSISNT